MWVYIYLDFVNGPHLSWCMIDPVCYSRPPFRKPSKIPVSHDYRVALQTRLLVGFQQLCVGPTSTYSSDHTAGITKYANEGLVSRMVCRWAVGFCPLSSYSRIGCFGMGSRSQRSNLWVLLMLFLSSCSDPKSVPPELSSEGPSKIAVCELSRNGEWRTIGLMKPYAIQLWFAGCKASVNTPRWSMKTQLRQSHLWQQRHTISPQQRVLIFLPICESLSPDLKRHTLWQWTQNFIGNFLWGVGRGYDSKCENFRSAWSKWEDAIVVKDVKSSASCLGSGRFSQTKYRGELESSGLANGSGKLTLNVYRTFQDGRKASLTVGPSISHS